LSSWNLHRPITRTLLKGRFVGEVAPLGSWKLIQWSSLNRKARHHE
jgi:hypothetical protein